jgi:hypothetical protein
MLNYNHAWLQMQERRAAPKRCQAFGFLKNIKMNKNHIDNYTQRDVNNRIFITVYHGSNNE